MRLQQVSKHCYAVINEKNRICDANSGFINLGGGVVIDTQSDLKHAQEMIDLFSTIWPAMPKYVVNTHEDSDHVWGNQLFRNAEIIAHQSVPERMKMVANPHLMDELAEARKNPAVNEKFKEQHPGFAAAEKQMLQDYDFNGVELVLPTKTFEKDYTIDLDGHNVELVYVGSCHQLGDTIVHFPEEKVVFAGDVVFQQCTPMSWVGSYKNWFKCLDYIISLEPEVIVPGHGPICDVNGIRELKGYLQYILIESKKYYDAGLTSLEAAKQIDVSAYENWNALSRLYMNCPSPV